MEAPAWLQGSPSQRTRERHCWGRTDPPLPAPGLKEKVAWFWFGFAGSGAEGEDAAGLWMVQKQLCAVWHKMELFFGLGAELFASFFSTPARVHKALHVPQSEDGFGR